jgi:hypothetical protein
MTQINRINLFTTMQPPAGETSSTPAYHEEFLENSQKNAIL